MKIIGFRAKVERRVAEKTNALSMRCLNRPLDHIFRTKAEGGGVLLLVFESIAAIGEMCGPSA